LIVQLIRELQDSLQQLDKRLRQTAGSQVGSISIRNETKKIVDRYFRSARQLLVDNSFPEVASADLDAEMQALLECSHHNTTVTKYRGKVKSVLSLLGDLEKKALIHTMVVKKDHPLNSVDQMISETLEKILPSAALSYKQALVDLGSTSRLSWRGPAVDLREALRETLDYLAPDKQVMAQSGFKFEKDCNSPTMKQKVRYILSNRGQSKSTMETSEQAATAIEEAVGSFVRSVYSRSSVSTHTPTDKDEVLRVRDLVRVAFCELLEVRQ
jgi:hypothetical protein